MNQSKIEMTINFLTDCQKEGYHLVTIGYPDNSNPACKPFVSWGQNNVFGWNPTFNDRNGPELCRISGRPAIWRIVEKYDISDGAGNGHQHQLKHKHNLIDGTYNTSQNVNIRHNMLLKYL